MVPAQLLYQDYCTVLKQNSLGTAKRKPVLILVVAARPQAKSFNETLELIAAPLRQMDEAGVKDFFALQATDVLIKTTLSLCPDCLAHVKAAVFGRSGKVWMNKRCDKHGASTAVLENDARWYRVSDKDRWGRVYGEFARFDIPAFEGGCCGPNTDCGPSLNSPSQTNHFTDQSANKACTVLVEITDACNLACRVCYSDSKGDRILSLEQFKLHLGELIAFKGRLDSVQVTGGEASLHPEFHDFVAWLCEQEGVGKVYLPTNGLLLSKPGFIERLKPFRQKLLVLLQFDGRDEQVNQHLRGAKPARQREKVIRLLDRAGIAMQLTMTLSPGVSEHDIEWVVTQGLAHKNVRLIAMQPAFFSGRYQLEASSTERLTLSDCVKGVVQGLGGRAQHEDFLPIPCSHPNCGWVTLFARRFGIVYNIARHVDLNAVMNEVAYKTLLNESQMQAMVGTRGPWWKRLAARVSRKLIRPQDVFGIAIKPFMDRFSYDQDRVSNCCHHILDTHGNAISFCEYNARLRSEDSWQGRPRLEQR